MAAPILSVLAGAGLMSARGPRVAVGPDEAAPADVEACRRGDRAALEAVFRAHAEPLARLLTRLIGPAADVEDLLQDTFAAAITAFPQFDGDGVADGADPAPDDPDRCGDSDADGCDDCAGGHFDLANDCAASGGGCCDAGAGGPAAPLALGGLVVAWVRRRRASSAYTAPRRQRPH